MMEDLDQSINNPIPLNLQLVWELRTFQNDLDLVVDLFDNGAGEVFLAWFDTDEGKVLELLVLGGGGLGWDGLDEVVERLEGHLAHHWVGFD